MFLFHCLSPNHKFAIGSAYEIFLDSKSCLVSPQETEKKTKPISIADSFKGGIFSRKYMRSLRWRMVAWSKLTLLCVYRTLLVQGDPSSIGLARGNNLPKIYDQTNVE